MKFIFFPVSENRENGLGDEGADGAMHLQNFWARTAPVTNAQSVVTVEDWLQWNIHDGQTMVSYRKHSNNTAVKQLLKLWPAVADLCAQFQNHT